MIVDPHSTIILKSKMIYSAVYYPLKVLLRLRKSIDFNRTGAGIVCLPPADWNRHQEENFYDTKCYAAGFGFRNR